MGLFNKGLIKIYSHPRSGTHFIEKFVGINFFSEVDLMIKPVEWGHWSNRKFNAEGNPYGKLFGTHAFPPTHTKLKGIYIYRDPRAVAYSIWKTNNFLHEDDSHLSFSDFLKLKIDWKGSPAFKSERELTIAQHWEEHVKSWLKYAEINSNVLIVRYEDLKDCPEKVFELIEKKFYPFRYFKRKVFHSKTDIKIVSNATGLLPNAATKDSWREVFTEEDESFFLGQIKDKKLINQYNENSSFHTAT